MILDSKSGLRGRVFDLETGKRVPKVRYLNTDTGYLEAYRVNDREEIVHDALGKPQWYAATGRFVFREECVPERPSVKLGASKCSLCPSTLTLLGDDLCPACKAKDRGQKNPMKVTKLTTPLLDSHCHCGRVAVWSVADEVTVTPQQHKGKLYSRGATVGRRFYCDRHYQPPLLLDSKGEIMQELEAIRPE